MVDPISLHGVPALFSSLGTLGTSVYPFYVGGRAHTRCQCVTFKDSQAVWGGDDFNDQPLTP